VRAHDNEWIAALSRHFPRLSEREGSMPRAEVPQRMVALAAGQE